MSQEQLPEGQESPPPTNPLDDLTQEQQDRLQSLEAEIGFDKLTISFSIEDRHASGQKRSAFFSATVSKRDGRAAGWTPDESKIISAMISKHVVANTFRDAMVRGVIENSEGAVNELRGTLSRYDTQIAKLSKTQG